VKLLKGKRLKPALCARARASKPAWRVLHCVVPTQGVIGRARTRVRAALACLIRLEEGN
jgi:hypothetical protein